jgi:cytochrome c oxidase subunit 2
MKHFIAVAVVIAALAALLLAGLQFVRLLPVQASEQAVDIDGLFQLHFVLIILLFSLIVGFMVYSILVFRRRKGDTTDAPHIEGNSTLELIWTIIPLLVVLAVSFIGAQTLGAVGAADPRPLEVEVFAQQWSWRFEYPEYGITANELFLPVNKQVVLKMISADVIHSFWVPEFRVKQDILPGGEEMVRELRVTPNRVGDYKVRCSEMCGRLHASMETPVHVLAQGDFDAWVNENTVPVSDDPAVRGEATAQQMGCLACHSLDGSVIVGPSWQGVFGSEERLTTGETVVVDEAYLEESIREPNVKVVDGFQPIMPDLEEQLTDEQISDLIEFIKSLE